MKKTKVGIIGIRGPARYGAFDQFVNQFVEYSNLNKKKIEFYISAENNHEKKIFKMYFNFTFTGERVFSF